ncbi:cysteine desulfurase [Sulfurimonas sp.]|uniref:cysteine desulfurase n=1 Tax=Sulfurimonas sp. TaxID=2022749 RepID=UPI0025CC650F|nr:cysteine desulfurase [Sulfurimonas sp.]
MYKLNYLNYPQTSDVCVSKELSIETLSTNEEFEKLSKSFTSKFNFSSLHSFSFSKEGFLGLMLELKVNIAVSLGESEAVVQAAKLYESLGFSVTYIDISKNAIINYKAIESLKEEYLFLSPYIIDTFVKVDLKKVKESFKGTVIANISANLDASNCDIIYFDAYKLSGYFTHSVLLHNDIFQEQNLANVDTIGLKLISDAVSKEITAISCKNEFIKVLKETIKDDLLFFVDADATLDNVLHFGLKDIKARQVIRNLSLDNIFVTNGEGCSLGLSRPSRVIQAMGYTELQSRQFLSLSFNKDLNSDEILYLVSKIGKSYRQIKALHA